MMTGKTLYVCLAMLEWNDCKLLGFPLIQGRVSTGSLGFLEVFDDVDTLKESYPDAEIMKIEYVED